MSIVTGAVTPAVVTLEFAFLAMSFQRLAIGILSDGMHQLVGGCNRECSPG